MTLSTELQSRTKSVKIVYADENDHKVEAIIQIPEEDYKSELTYRDNMERIVNNIVDEGGFWLDASTIIPFHRIRAIKTFVPQQKPAKRYRSRNKRAHEKHLSDSNKVSRHPDTSGPKN